MKEENWQEYYYDDGYYNNKLQIFIPLIYFTL